MAPRIPLSSVDDEIAKEKGRLRAAQAIAQHPEQRKRLEDTYGTEYCKRRYPEAYAPSPFFRRIIDSLKF